MPLIIWFLISFFQDLPEEVEESAKVNGATEWQLFCKIVLPLVAPGIAMDAINAEGTYDLCMVDGSWMAEFTENGVLANLSELGYELDDDIIPATTSICYVGDDVYLAPYYGNVTVLMFNKANVEAAGYTADTIASLDDVLKICQQAQADGKKGFIYRGDGQNKELAVELLKYLMDPEVQKSTVPSGGVPCRYSSLQYEEVLATYPQYAVVCDALETGVYRPVIAEWTQFYTILGTAEMDNIINGVKTVDQGLADAQTQLEELMG